MTSATIRLTAAQALVRAMAVQHTSVDGKTVPLFGGVWAIFGHGNVAGLGEACPACVMCCRPFAPTTSRRWRMPPLAMPRHCAVGA